MTVSGRKTVAEAFSSLGAPGRECITIGAFSGLRRYALPAPQIPSRVPSATAHINTLRCPASVPPIPHATLAMLNRTLPYYLEDRTGLHTASDYDDIYDRLFLRVTCSAPAPPQVARTPSSSSANSMLSSSPPSSSPLAAPPQPFTIAISNTGRRSSTRSYLTGQAPSARGQPPPSVVLEFGRGGALGSVALSLHGKASRAPMAQWLRKTGMFAGSLSRKFVASSGHELRWIHRGYSGHEWTVRAVSPSQPRVC